MGELPPGQRLRTDLPRFGITQYARRFPDRPDDPALEIVLPDGRSNVLADALAGLPRLTIQADLHCVTTWSVQGLTWGGVRFSAFFDNRVRPLIADCNAVIGVIVRAQDGYLMSLPMSDLMATDVLIADELNGEPLSIAHGAPLRLVAPAHYGYKSLKHLKRIEFCTEQPVVKRGILAFLDHPRARVDVEERGQWLPGWLLRYLYRPLIARTEAQFSRALKQAEIPHSDS